MIYQVVIVSVFLFLLIQSLFQSRGTTQITAALCLIQAKALNGSLEIESFGLLNQVTVIQDHS